MYKWVYHHKFSEVISKYKGHCKLKEWKKMHYDTLKLEGFTS